LYFPLEVYPIIDNVFLYVKVIKYHRVVLKYHKPYFILSVLTVLKIGIDYTGPIMMVLGAVLDVIKGQGIIEGPISVISDYFCDM
jgi:hypothetical protein